MTLNSSTEPTTNAQARIALVSFDSLGDGLIYLMIADNLRRNGFDVTCYGNVAHQMRAWLPNLNVRPYPAIAQFEAELEGYDLAIVSPPSFIRAKMDEAATIRLREKWLLVCQKTPESWRFDHTENLRNTLAPEKFRQIQKLLNSGGSIRFCRDAGTSAVEMALRYLREKMGLEKVSGTPPIVAPEGLSRRKYEKRIVVSPDSAGPEKKNWRPGGFLALCRRLKLLGYAPEIVVAPNHHADWVKKAGGAFAVPRFDDIGGLAAYLYESCAIIANDSGNGHLASFLGIPVVTLYRKKNPRFYWRPDWNREEWEDIVICPFLPFGKTFLWKYLISRKRIIKAVERLQNEAANASLRN